jgi:hypothetical protein
MKRIKATNRQAAAPAKRPAASARAGAVMNALAPLDLRAASPSVIAETMAFSCRAAWLPPEARKEGDNHFDSEYSRRLASILARFFDGLAVREVVEVCYRLEAFAEEGRYAEGAIARDVLFDANNAARRIIATRPAASIDDIAARAEYIAAADEEGCLFDNEVDGNGVIIALRTIADDARRLGALAPPAA